MTNQELEAEYLVEKLAGTLTLRDTDEYSMQIIDNVYAEEMYDYGFRWETFEEWKKRKQETE